MKAVSVVMDDEKAAELELIRRAQDGDQDAYGVLVETHQARIHASVMRQVRDDHRALDITQDAFVQAWKAIDSYEDRARFGTWLYRIAMNLVTSHYRRKNAQKRGGGEGHASLDQEGVPDPGAHVRAPDELVEAVDTGNVVRAAINELEDEYRTVIILRDLQDFSYDEIAEELGIAAGTVRSRLHRGRERLREKLKHLME